MSRPNTSQTEENIKMMPNMDGAEGSLVDPVPLRRSTEKEDDDDEDYPERPLPQKRTLWQSIKESLDSESHPLPPNPNFIDKFKSNFYCPPQNKLGALILIIILATMLWPLTLATVGQEALPGGSAFGCLSLFFAASIAGYLMKFIKLPPLLGMLIVGCVMGNVKGIDFAADIKPLVSSSLRNAALTVILVRAGLGLDPNALKKLSFVVFRLAFSPCLAETAADGLAAHFIIGLPWAWSFMLGFIIAAVSPAVVVPSLLGLSEKGYGVDKGIPTLVIAASSVDDVLAITGFGVMLGMAFSTGNIAWTLGKGPLEAVVGIVYGCVLGVILWYIPPKKGNHVKLFRSILLLGFCLLAVFGSKHIDWSGSGPLASLTLPFVAALRWRKEPDAKKNSLSDITATLWMIFQPFLFGLIGAEVKIKSLNANLVGKGVAVLMIGLGIRICVAFLTVFGTQLNFKERLFVPIAWLPKATVQAAIGAVALDKAVENGDDQLIEYGRQILNIAVLSILITAPIGAILMAITGPCLLERTRGPEQDVEPP